MAQYQANQNRRDPRTPIQMQERVQFPIIWLVVIGLVAAGFVVHLAVSLLGGGGMVVWPFVFAVCVLLIVNDASNNNAVGVPPLQAYGLFFGVLAAFFAFVFLVSSTINPWLIVVGAIATGAWLVYDWIGRQRRQRAIDRLRMQGLCVRCQTPVSNGRDDVCPNCFLPVNPERMNLFRLGLAIANKSRSQTARQVLTGRKLGRTQLKEQALRTRLAKPASYRKKG